jgi:phosphinothricin acetyltransferase
MAAYCEIINHYIETTAINFRTEAQTLDEWREDWKRFSAACPWLVAVDGDQVVGLSYATPWKPRRAYDWTVETTVYVRDGHRGHGIGRALYTRLLEILDAQGYRSEIGVVMVPNTGSVAVHEAVGFTHVGTLADVGYKHGGWHSTALFQRRVDGGAPTEILPVSVVLGSAP